MNQDALFPYVVALLGLCLLWFFFRMDQKADNGWKFMDMLMGFGRDGKWRADRVAFAFVGAFFISSAWGTWQAWNHELTEWFFNGYMISWAAAAAASSLIKARHPNPLREEEDEPARNTRSVQAPD